MPPDKSGSKVVSVGLSSHALFNLPVELKCDWVTFNAAEWGFLFGNQETTSHFLYTNEEQPQMLNIGSKTARILTIGSTRDVTSEFYMAFDFICEL